MPRSRAVDVTRSRDDDATSLLAAAAALTVEADDDVDITSSAPKVNDF